MLHKYLLRKELAKLQELEDRRVRTSSIIKAEQVALKQVAIRSIGSGEVLLLSFAAGCALRIAVKHGVKITSLRHLPISRVLGLIGLIGQLKGEQ